MSGLESRADAAVMNDVSTDRRAVGLSYLYAVVVGLALGHFRVGIPIQLTDSFGNMLKLSPSWADLLYAEFTQQAYLRPMLWAELKVVYDASGGDYFSWFHGTHVAQVAAMGHAAEMLRLLKSGEDPRRALACLAGDLDLGDVAEYLAAEDVASCEPGQALAHVIARTTTAGAGE